MSEAPSGPPGASSGRESCPLCGVDFDPAKGHACDDPPAAGIEIQDDDVQQELSVAPVPVSDPFAERYEIIEELSRGGMGVVYKARHKALNNTVAVKVLLQPGNETDQRRFLQEAQLASKVNHPNTVYISDFGVLPDGKSFLVMEYLEGPTLSALIRRQAKHQLDILRACRIATQIAQGMQTVHDKGIVHREPFAPPRRSVLGFQKRRLAARWLWKSATSCGAARKPPPPHP